MAEELNYGIYKTIQVRRGIGEKYKKMFEQLQKIYFM